MDEGAHRGTDGVAFEVSHLGCKVSYTDAQAISEALADAGHAEDAASASIRVVNACCITRDAERTSRQRVRRMVAELGDDRGHVFVTGCGAANDPGQYAAIDERVTVLPGAASLAAAAIVDAADGLAGLACRGPAPGLAPGHEPGFGRRSRAFVKVQDGCSFECSYCIVPAVRGGPRSRRADAVADEVRRRVGEGRREIVLTGVNIGLYRDPDTRIGLPQLLHAVAGVDGVHRIRISSIEVNHVTPRLLEAMAQHPLVCPHLHVPLQSGDDAVLREMRRHHDTARYRRAVELAREALPGLNLTTDVIVGYPTEDDTSFARTLDFVEELGFTKVHAFPFSERPGTPATMHADPVERSVKADRSRQLRAIADAAALRHRATLVGRLDEVVVETRRSRGYGAGAGVRMTDDHVAAPDRAASAGRTGYTRDYSPVELLDLPADVGNGDLVEVRLRSLDALGVLSGSYRGTLRPAGPVTSRP